MQRALAVCLALIGGCSTPTLDVGGQQAAIKSGKSCLIGGVSYDKGQADPANPCELCKPERDPTGWTSADDGARCDDGNECTRADRCQAGICVGGDPFVCKPKDDYQSPVKAECCLHGSAVIGPTGGTVTTGNGTSVEIPLGAVDSNTTITVTESDTPAPAGAVSPRIDFGPDGIVFAHPVKVTIPLTRATGKLTTFWTRHDGSGQFAPVGGTVVGDNMVVDVTHFSSAYVAADPGTRDINGTEIVTWVAPNNIINQPTDLRALPVEALVADGAGGYTAYAGLGQADGTFAIGGIPAGVAIIHAGSFYTQLDITNVTSVDLGSGRNGRPDQTPADLTSSFVFNVDMTIPWSDADRMEFFCSNDTWLFDIQELGLGGFPVAGATSIANMSAPEQDFLDEIGVPANLVIKGDPATHPGDVCTLAHLVAQQTADNPPVAYTAMAETFNPDPFDQNDGAATTLTGAFQANPLPSTVSVDVQTGLFGPLFATVPAGAVLSSNSNLDVAFAILGAQGGPFSIRTTGNTADFVLMDLGATGRTVASNIQFGQPLAGSWDAFVFVGMQASYNFNVPGTNRFPNAIQSLGSTIDLAGAPTPLEIAPRLGPPVSPTIDGLDWLQVQTGVSATATIAWSPPEVGTPDLYQLDVFHLADQRPAKRHLATLATAATSLTLPAGLLTPGDQYFFTLTALNKKPRPETNPPPILAAPFYFADVTNSANGFSAPIAIAP